jgi:hypothetical protein
LLRGDTYAGGGYTVGACRKVQGRPAVGVCQIDVRESAFFSAHVFVETVAQEFQDLTGTMKGTSVQATRLGSIGTQVKAIDMDILVLQDAIFDCHDRVVGTASINPCSGNASLFVRRQTFKR